MALIESVEYQFDAHGIASIAIDEFTVMKEDGVETLRSKPMTRAVNPDSDISMYPSNVQAACNAHWTEELRAAYKAAKTI